MLEARGGPTFQGFVDYVIEPARTQVLAYVHISAIGLTCGPVGEMIDLQYGDPERTAFVAHHWQEALRWRQGAAGWVP